MNDFARSGIVFTVAFTEKAPTIAADAKPRIDCEERATLVSPRSSPVQTSQRGSLRLEPTPRRTLARLVGGTSRLARMLALARRVECAIDAGDLSDPAEAAETFGISRPRMTQVARLALRPPSIQEAILDGRLDATERELHSVAEPVASKDQGTRRLRLAR